tara:strand:- start:4465 stop:5535 length:1071 start_codon:yes stop_codon:yes gene_type:complete
MINRVLQAKQEIDRVNKKFEDGIENLLPSEIETFCSFNMVMNQGTESLPKICSDFKFKAIYLNYHHDLTFQSEYFKPNYGSKTTDSLSFYSELKENNDQSENATEFDNEKYKSFRNKAKERGFERKVEKAELEKDIAYLNQIAKEWQITIDIPNHSDQKLKQTSEETREIIREIKRNAKKNNISDSIRDNNIKLALWKSKYIHYQGMLIAEQIEIKDSLPYELKLNGNIVYFTYRSLIHILYRHFAQLVSNTFFQQTKSYHSPIFQPNKIHLILENIFARLSHSEYFKNIELEHNVAYNFQYKGINYQLYLKYFGDNKDKLMVSSVYPIEDEMEKEKLNGFELKTIDSELKVYKKL